MISKLMRHAREGTLIRATMRKLGLIREAGADPDHYHGQTAKGYLEKRLKQEMWHREQEIVQDLLASYSDGLTVLDVAFGTGRFVDMYLEKDMTIYGIDISEDMLTAARDALGASFDRCQVDIGSADSLPYQDEFFDLVVCFRFFGLIPFDMARRVLSEIHRVGKDHVIIRVPVRKDSAGPLPPPKDTDVVQGRLLESELESLFAEFGFSVKEQRPISEREKVVYVVYVLGKSLAEST